MSSLYMFAVDCNGFDFCTRWCLSLKIYSKWFDGCVVVFKYIIESVEFITFHRIEESACQFF